MIENMDKLQEMVEHIKMLGVNILIVRDGVAAEAVAPLKNAGIITYQKNGKI